MAVADVPEEVRALAEERAARRAARDFAAADELRERISALGWRVVDEPGGYRLAPRPPPRPGGSRRGRSRAPWGNRRPSMRRFSGSWRGGPRTSSGGS